MFGLDDSEGLYKFSFAIFWPLQALWNYLAYNKTSLSVPFQVENSNEKPHYKQSWTSGCHQAPCSLTVCQGREALHAQHTAPLLPYLVPRAATGGLLDPFSLSAGQGLFTSPPYLDTSLSDLAEEEENVIPYVQGSSLPPAFLIFPCPGLCSGSLRKPSTLLSPERADCGTGFWFHSPAGCFPHCGSLIPAFPPCPAVFVPWVQLRAAPTKPSPAQQRGCRPGLCEAAASRTKQLMGRSWWRDLNISYLKSN